MGERGFRLAPRRVPGRPDITFASDHLAVFVHGCFWHRHGCKNASQALPKSNRAYWEVKFQLNVERDARKARVLETLGWNVVTVWECEIGRDAEAAARKVKAERAISRLSSGVKSQNTGPPHP